MKVSELNPPELDYWVAQAEGLKPIEMDTVNNCCVVGALGYWPSTDWSQGGPIIEREGIELEPWSESDLSVWCAGLVHNALPLGEQRAWAKGPTPLIAAMRAYCASKFGETVAE